MDRYTDITDHIGLTDLTYRHLVELRDTVEEVSSRAYETTLTEYHLGILFGFDERPFVFLGVLGERLCEQFDQVVSNSAKRLDTELCNADDDEPEWWVPINVAATRATRESVAWLKDVELLQYRLSKAAERDLGFLW